jgi:hypothetical protein
MVNQLNIDEQLLPSLSATAIGNPSGSGQKKPEGGYTMTVGPIEYLVFAFPDGKVSDEIAPELGDLVDKKVIRILGAVFVTKASSGDVTAAEFDELDHLAGFVEIDAEVGGMISPNDISFVGAELDPGSAAAVLLVEDLWARCPVRPRSRARHGTGVLVE